MSIITYDCSTIAVLLTMSMELPMTLTTRHGVQRQVPVKLQPHRYQGPVVKTSHKTTIKTHQTVVMPPLVQEPINQ